MNKYRNLFCTELNKLAILLFIFFVSCQKAPDDTSKIDKKSDIIILNNGSWGDNNANISLYDIESEGIVSDAFLKMNNKKLGDLGQDIIRIELNQSSKDKDNQSLMKGNGQSISDSQSGERYVIAVSGSKIIFITDSNLNIIKEIKPQYNNVQLSPRCVRYSNGKLYVSLYEGYLAEIDMQSYESRYLPLGLDCPEELVCGADGNVYIAISGDYTQGFDNKIIVVNAEKMQTVDTIKVNKNPVCLRVNPSATKLYALSYGDYGDVAPAIQMIDISDFTSSNLSANSKGVNISDLSLSSKSFIDFDSSETSLYVLCGDKVEILNVESGEKEGEFSFESDLNPYSISVARDGNVYVGFSDYKTTGTVNIYNPQGSLLKTFDSAGLNPQKII